MLNTKKLLYILPDSALIAELLPTKKPHSFAVQSFRQINGNFIDENEFIVENIEKLLKKIDPDEYTLILPDFLFTNTIVDVHHTSETEVKRYLKEELLPSLDLSKETHEIDTFILTQRQGKSKVQLSALEKSLLAPLQKGAAEQKIKIDTISPLSWTIKSVVSLEPSLSTIQLGNMLYIAQHYIGVDQTISYSIEETNNIIETVKTLKGAEPNIQTMYLLTNALIESEIKEKLSGTLPIQQLSNFTEDQDGMPAYVKQIIESAAKTLDLPDQPVPKFSLGKLEAAAEAPAKEESKKTPEVSSEEITDEKVPTKSIDLDEEEETAESEELPAPTPPPLATMAAAAATIQATSPVAAIPTPAVPEVKISIEKESVIEEKMTITTDSVDSMVEDLFETSPEKQATDLTEKEETIVSEPIRPSKLAEEKEIVSSMSTSMQSVEDVPSPFTINFPLNPTSEMSNLETSKSSVLGGVPMNQPISSNQNMSSAPVGANPTQPGSYPIGQVNQPGIPPRRPVIKNKNDAGALFKVVLITLGALIATVGIGVGIGLGVLRLSENSANNLTQNPSVQTSATPVAAAPSPSLLPSPSPVATIAKDKLKILVVNATTTSGKAGKTKKALTDAGYKTVDTGNAKGSYTTPGTFLLLSNDDPSLLSQLTTDSGLTLSAGTAKKETEDPKNAYDAVIVLAE